jgi:hypothetical protein
LGAFDGPVRVHPHGKEVARAVTRQANRKRALK